jgi:hypothetical protein
MVIPGTVGEPAKKGTGIYRARWNVALGICVSGPTKERTIRICQLQTAAVRMILLQHQELKGSGDTAFAQGVTWVKEDYTPGLNRETTRSIAMGMLQFYVDVDAVASTAQGPLEVINDGTVPTGWPTVETPVMGLTAYPISEVVGT